MTESHFSAIKLLSLALGKVDPMFQVMSATFDEGGASGLLMNHLRCYNDSQLLVLDSNAVMPITDEQTTDSLLSSHGRSQHIPLDVSEVKGKTCT